MKAKLLYGGTMLNAPYTHYQSKIYLPQFLLYIPRPWLVQPGPLDLHFVYACGGPLLPVYRLMMMMMMMMLMMMMMMMLCDIYM